MRDSDAVTRAIIGTLLVLLVVGGALDLAIDLPAGAGPLHQAFDVALLVLGITASVLLWRGWSSAERVLEDTQEALAVRTAERDVYLMEARSSLVGLGVAIQAQFGAWGLTPAEREVALLLLKGNSHKEVAYLTGRSERTVRQHAVAAYRKSGLDGRAALAAYFLGDLELPSAAAEVDGRRHGEGRDLISESVTARE